MGLCDSNNENLGNCYNQVKIDGEIKDLIHLSYEMVDKKHNKKLGEK